MSLPLTSSPSPHFCKVWVFPKSLFVPVGPVAADGPFFNASVADHFAKSLDHVGIVHGRPIEVARPDQAPFFDKLTKGQRRKLREDNESAIALQIGDVVVVAGKTFDAKAPASNQEERWVYDAIVDRWTQHLRADWLARAWRKPDSGNDA